jgi:hypothetical protein
MKSYELSSFLSRLFDDALKNLGYVTPNKQTNKQANKTNSMAFSLQTNYTDPATANCCRNLMPTFVDRGVSRGQRGGYHTVVNLSFLDWSSYFSFK